MTTNCASIKSSHIDTSKSQTTPEERDQLRLRIIEHGFDAVAQASGYALNTLYSWNYRYRWGLGTKGVHTKTVTTVCTERKTRKIDFAALDAKIRRKRDRVSRTAMERTVVKLSTNAARAARHVPTRTVQDMKAIEDMRTSVFPTPTRIESVNVNVSGGLSREALDRMLSEARLM